MDVANVVNQILANIIFQDIGNRSGKSVMSDFSHHEILLKTLLFIRKKMEIAVQQADLVLERIQLLEIRQQRALRNGRTAFTDLYENEISQLQHMRTTDVFYVQHHHRVFEQAWATFMSA